MLIVLGVLGALIVVLLAGLVLGVHLPSIPWAGAVGSVVVGHFPAVVLILLGLASAAVWKFTGGASRTIILVMAAAAAGGTLNAMAQVIAVANANGVRLKAGSLFGQRAGPAGAPADEARVYGRDLEEDLELSVFRPSSPTPGDGWPVLVYVHGGGWIGGTRSARDADLRWFAEQGWVVVTVDYSLSTEDRHLWDRVTPQIGCALAWIGDNIRDHGGNADRLAIFGESAGGNLVLNAGYLANAGRLASPCGGTVPTLDAVISIYPGVDLEEIYKNQYIPTGAAVRDMVTKYVGGPISQYPDRYAAVASATYIDPTAPPTLVFISENDHLVPRASMEAFVGHAREGGIEVRSVSIPYAEHGFDVAGMGNAIFRQVTLQFLNQHVSAAPDRRD